MATQHDAHIQPSKHSTDQVDDFLDKVEDNVDQAPGAVLAAARAHHFAFAPQVARSSGSKRSYSVFTTL